MELPKVIDKVIATMPSTLIPQDTAFEELQDIAQKTNEADQELAYIKALYSLGFGKYNGF